MPIYEYRCDACKHEFEKLIFSTGDKSVTCPKCGAKKVKRLLSSSCVVSGNTASCSPGASGPGRGFS